MSSCSAYKFHGSKGVGCLWLWYGTRFRPLLRGDHQVHGRWAGTEDISDAVGIGAASELAQVHLPGTMQISQLHDRLKQHSQVTIPTVTVMGSSQPRVLGILNLVFECIEGKAILLLMNQTGVTAPNDSACTSGSLKPPRVIWAMNIPHTVIHGTAHFSLSRYTREKEIDYVAVTLPSVIGRPHILSPYWRQDQPHLRGGAFTPVYG